MYIAIGAGHNPEASGVTVDFLVEHELASLVADSVQMLVAPSGIPLIRIPSFVGDKSTSLNKKVRFCNHYKSLLKCAIEIHYNSFRGDGRAHGTETLIANSAFQLNARTKKYADILQRKMITALGTRDRGVKSEKDSAHGKLAFLRNTLTSAMILEVCFLTDSMDVKLAGPEGITRTANGITRAILDIASSI